MMKINGGRLMLFLIVMVTLSCSKKTNWNCSCTASASINPNGAAPVYTTVVENASKANATNLCNKWGGQQMPANSFTCTVTAE